MVKVSVITPVYHAAQYIERCVRSLMEQTLDDIEYIFIDDCGGDDSMDIVKRVIQEYSERMSQVKLLYNGKNMGSASTRNRGLDVATGEYITFLDADDWFDKDGIECMYTFMTFNHLDAGYSGLIKEYSDGNSMQVTQPKYNSLDEVRQAILRGKLLNNPCNKMYKRELLTKTGEKFVDGADMAEDKSLNIRLFLQANRIDCYPNAPYYHYNLGNSSSICHYKGDNGKLLKNLNAEIANLHKVLDTISSLGYESKYYKEVMLLKLGAKSILLKNGYKKELLRRWINLYPESNKYIFLQNSRKAIKISEWLLAHHMYFLYKITTNYIPIN